MLFRSIEIFPVALGDGSRDGGGVDVGRMIGDDDELGIVFVKLVKTGSTHPKLNIGSKNEIAEI